MEKIFKPQSKSLVYESIVMYICVSLMFAAAVISGNSVKNLIQVFIILFGLATVFLAMFWLSRIIIKNGDISIFIFVISRHTTAISNISSIKYLINYAGLGKALVLHYQGKLGMKRTMRIGIGAYGDEQTREILELLIKQNSRIELDQPTIELLQPQKK